MLLSASSASSSASASSCADESPLSMRFLVSRSWWQSGDIVTRSKSLRPPPPLPPIRDEPGEAAMLLRALLFSSRSWRLPAPLIARSGMLKLSCLPLGTGAIATCLLLLVVMVLVLRAGSIMSAGRARNNKLCLFVCLFACGKAKGKGTPTQTKQANKLDSLSTNRQTHWLGYGRCILGTDGGII